MRLIDADTLMPKLKDVRKKEFQVYGKAFSHFSERYLNAVEDAPAVDMGKDAPPSKGAWVKKWWRSDGLMFACSECGSLLTVSDGEMNFGYCPYCGAKMKRDEGVNGLQRRDH